MTFLGARPELVNDSGGGPAPRKTPGRFDGMSEILTSERAAAGRRSGAAAQTEGDQNGLVIRTPNCRGGPAIRIGDTAAATYLSFARFEP